MARHIAPRRHRTALQRSVIALNVGAAVVCVALAGTITWSWQRVREIPRIELGGQLAAEPDDGDTGAQNFLIVGTDSADALPDDDPVRVGRDNGIRSDTIMIVRLDPDSESASLVSLPRDLYLPIAEVGRNARINTAIQGGPGRLVATINDALDIPIHHYVEIDLQGFRDLVAAVDGVPVYFPEPVRDRQSILSVPDAGCVTLDPVQALAFVRSRSYEVQRDGRWEVDGTGDFGRVSRQQDFIRRALHRAFQRGARNPAVLADLVEVGTEAITIDGTLTPASLLELGRRFRSFDPDSLVTYALPVSDDIRGGAEVLRLDTVAAQPILDVFRGADPHRVAPDNTVVQVRNGTPQAALAEEVATELRGLDFVLPPEAIADATSFDVARTTVLYREGEEERAALVARALEADPVVEEGDFILGADIVVVVGADWPGTVEELRPETPGLVTTTTTGASPSTTTPSTVPESTAPRGAVPANPEGARC
jgi:polyisoprenyl-teichoic acid--peptidoglycan teichoic acid transferase